MKCTKLFVIAATAGLALSGSAQAQSALINCGGATEAGLASGSVTCRLTNTVSAIVPTVARLSIDNTSTTLNAPKAVDFGGSGVPSTGPLLTVSANAAYSLTASAQGGWTKDGSASGKPIGDLTIKSNSGSLAAIGGFGGGAATASATYQIGYNTVYNWTTDTPGTYQLVLNYTLTAP